MISIQHFLEKKWSRPKTESKAPENLFSLVSIAHLILISCQQWQLLGITTDKLSLESFFNLL